MTPEEKEKSYQESIDHCNKWDAMYKRYGAYGMAEKMLKLESYRKYIQRWPFDFSPIVVGLNYRGEDPGEDIELIDEGPSLDELVDIRLEMEKLEESLTPRQKDVYHELLDGKTNSEIEKKLGFGANSTVRWTKNQIKKRYQEVKQPVVHEYVCRSCAWIYKDRTALECPKCGSRDVFKISLD